MARVTLYTDKSKVGETTRVEDGACCSIELGHSVLNANADSAQGLGHSLHNPLYIKPRVFLVIHPDQNILNTN